MSDALAGAEVAIRAGEPSRALELLTVAVKASPAKPTLRIFMAQLLCVMGQWERAHTQLTVAADLDSTAGPMRDMVGHALRCELLRAEVFAGKRAPMVFGQPDDWLALMIESLLQSGAGAVEVGHQLASRAFDAAPATRGMFNGEPFDWIADADSRLGPVLEAMVNGRYYWIPFNRLSRIFVEDLVDLRDRVWMPAQLTFSNGGEAIAMLPTRYPGSEHSKDGQIQMAAKTLWSPIGDERFVGLGQRVLATNVGEHDLLTLRLLELEPDDAGEEAMSEIDG